MRKTTPRFPSLILAFLFALPVAGLFALLSTPEAAAIDFTPQVNIGTDISGQISAEKNTIGLMIKAYYNYAIGIVGILATVVMMIGGIVWITAGGNNTRIAEAKAWIGASLTGLVLALASYTILAAISPNLVNFTAPIVPEPRKQNAITVCCEVTGDTSLGSSCSITTMSRCTDQLNGTPQFGGECISNKCVINYNLPCASPSAGLGTTCALASGKAGYCDKNRKCVPCKPNGDSCGGTLFQAYNWECCSNTCKDDKCVP